MPLQLADLHTPADQDSSWRENCATISGHMCMLQVTVGANRLEQRLEVENTGDAPLSFTTALHTYYTVSSIHNVLAHPCFVVVPWWLMHT